MPDVSSKLTLSSMINIDAEHAIDLSFLFTELHDVLLIASLHVFEDISRVREGIPLLLVKSGSVFIHKCNEFRLFQFDVGKLQFFRILGVDLVNCSWGCLCYRTSSQRL